MKKYIFSVLAMLLLVTALSLPAFATESKTDVSGKVYEFDKDSHYELYGETFSEVEETDTYGDFSIAGNITDVTVKDGIPAYKVDEGKLKLFYSYENDMLIGDNEDVWHLIEDKSKKINDLKLDENILNGAIILQISNDRLNWITVLSETDAFNKTPIRTEEIYETSDVQLINGCYYRVIVAYELRIRTKESNILFVDMDKYDYKKCAEVYEFYAYSKNSELEVADLKSFNLGKKVKVSDFDSYSGEKQIDENDAHKGWDIGQFYVTGYTSDVKDKEGNPVFLKNVGNKVTLWFALEQNINAIQGDEKLYVTADTKGYDEYFEQGPMDFGKGALIIRYVDRNNSDGDPVIYTNYLEANTSVGAETKVQLFEEGDYEIALDYEITKDKVIDEVGHYRIFFKFSVRNGNCMVYPFDVATGSELTNSSVTENGFRIDLGNSKYLNVNVKREVLTEGSNGLIEDIRSNSVAHDGDEFTDEGIYTITVSNDYTGQSTTKKIYVGTNNVLKAHITTGLSVEKINDLVNQGATIANDGTIELVTIVQPSPKPDNSESTEGLTTNPTEQSTAFSDTTESTEGSVVHLTVGIIAVCTIAIIVILKKKYKSGLAISEEDENAEGGTEE